MNKVQLETYFGRAFKPLDPERLAKLRGVNATSGIVLSPVGDAYNVTTVQGRLLLHDAEGRGATLGSRTGGAGDLGWSFLKTNGPATKLPGRSKTRVAQLDVGESTPVADTG
jgi:hypothetical protein